jgi:hypothetical protein
MLLGGVALWLLFDPDQAQSGEDLAKAIALVSHQLDAE